MPVLFLHDVTGLDTASGYLAHSWHFVVHDRVKFKIATMTHKAMYT